MPEHARQEAAFSLHNAGGCKGVSPLPQGGGCGRATARSGPLPRWFYKTSSHGKALLFEATSLKKPYTLHSTPTLQGCHKPPPQRRSTPNPTRREPPHHAYPPSYNISLPLPGKEDKSLLCSDGQCPRQPPASRGWNSSFRMPPRVNTRKKLPCPPKPEEVLFFACFFLKVQVIALLHCWRSSIGRAADL